MDNLNVARYNIREIGNFLTFNTNRLTTKTLCEVKSKLIFWRKLYNKKPKLKLTKQHWNGLLKQKSQLRQTENIKCFIFLYILKHWT